MTGEHVFRTRMLRVIAAFVAFLSSLVLIPGPDANAASDDLFVTFGVDNSAIAYGSVSNWTVDVATSADVTLATGIVVTSTLPDGLCPYGAGDPDCAGGTAPAPAFNSATENADGSWTLVWNLSDMATSDFATITYSTETRPSYQEGYVDDKPVLARDSWVNSVQVTGTVDGLATSDTATVGQTAAGVTITEQIATRPASLTQPDVCGDGSGLIWNDASATGYRIGDQICRRIIIDYPVDLTTSQSIIGMAVPTGQGYMAEDTWSLGAGSTVALVDVDGSSITPGVSALTWSIGDGLGYVGSAERLELVYSTTVVNPAATTSGQYVTSVASHQHTTTSGNTITLTDAVAAQILEAQLDLFKGVVAINGVPVAGGAAVDGTTVREADVVTYQLSLVNSGALAASDVEVWDLLPTLVAPCSTQVTSISDAGVCVDASHRIDWSGVGALAVSAGATVTVTYDATIPAGISPEVTLTNRAGVVSYTSATNTTVAEFTYRPSGNIDGVASSNTGSADDGSSVKTAVATITNSRTTSIAESGNHADSQATIGELITYTITVLVPEGSTVYSAELVDDLPANLDLVSASHTFDGEAALVQSEDPVADSVSVTFPDPSYRNAPGSGDDTLVLTVVGRVLDVPGNLRGVSIPNTAVFTWLDQDAAPQTKTAGVSTTVVEPYLSIVKTSTDSIGNNGVVIGNEVVDYSITITNPGTAGVATAHDLVVVDTIPEGVTLTTPVPDGGVWTPDATPGDGIGGTITWTFTPLAAAASIGRSYQVTVDDPVIVSSAFFNTVEVDATSLAGVVSEERTAGTGYHAEDSDVLNTPLAGLTRDAVPQYITVGDTVTYTVNVTMPPGTIMYDATVLETLPSGLAFDGLVSSSCDMAGSPCDPMIAAVEIGTPGTTTAAFSLDDIDASSTTGDPRVVTIEYTAHVLDSGAAGSTRTSVGSVYGNQSDQISGIPAVPPSPAGFDVVVGPAADTLTMVEPALVVDKDVAGQAGDGDYRRAVPGETLTFTVAVSNPATTYAGDAYDLTIVDVVPEGLQLSLPVADGGVWIADGVPGDGIGGTVTWSVAGPVAPGGSVTRSYDAVVDASLSSTDEQVGSAEETNTVDVASYFAVSAAERVVNPDYTYREYDNVTADAVQIELDLASIGDTVWFDVNGDGVHDPGEPPLPGVDVTVRYFGADGVISGDDEIHGSVTDGAGTYLVEHLPGGTYTVVVDSADIPPGFVPAYDLDGGTLSPNGSWGPGPLAENEDKLSVDFGYTGNGSIGDTVWFDRDGDGSRDGDEYGLEGLVMDITWLGLDGVAGGDDVAYQVTTDADGGFGVDYLPAGNYIVAVDTASLPAGMTPTHDSDGTGTPHTSLLTLAGGEDNTGQDFGYWGPGAIGDAVWFDRDGDAIWDAGEPGLVGVPIGITWPGEDGLLGGGDDDLFLVVTDGAGAYGLDGLPPGEYAVAVLGGLPAAAANTYDEDGGNDAMTVVGLADGESHLSADFGFQGSASIGDAVWWDRDGDGTIDPGEPGIPGVALELTFAGIDGVLDTGDDLVFVTATDATGSYLFTDLPAGNYRVVVDSGIPDGMDPTHDDDGGLDQMSLVPGLAVDQIYLSADFGYIGTGSIGDIVWLDLNGDGTLDPSEPGLPDVTVEATWFGVDGTFPSVDDFTLTTTTDLDGGYSFPDLPGGTYQVSVVAASLPLGVTPTFDADGVISPNRAVVALAGGAGADGLDFGYFGGALIGDVVWFDQDGDGIRNSGEYGIAGVDLDVIWAGPDGIHANADDETFAVTSDASGAYTVSNLPPGQYAVVVDAATLPAGMVAAVDEDGVLDDQTLFELTELAVHDTADFGYFGTGSIGDLVWLDRDADGIAAGSEPGIPLQEIELSAAGVDGFLGTGDDQIYAAVTDADGRYVFANLPPDLYSVAVIGSITAAASNTADADGTADSYTVITLADAVAEDTIDFGYTGTASIGDLVWLDLNADGTQDGDDPGLTGVEVTATWLGADDLPGTGDDVALPAAVTDGAGTYFVTGLPDGDYQIAVTGGIPDGLSAAVDPDGGYDASVVAADLLGPALDTSYDFGFVGAGIIEGTVWWDLDDDGSPGEREPGLAAVDMHVIWAGFDGIVATADDAGFDLATGSGGEYHLSSLPPGSYEVEVGGASLPAGVAPSADPDPLVDGVAVAELIPGGPIAELSFGVRGEAMIGGAIWVDVGNDGVCDGDDPGLDGVEVSVAYATGGDPIVFTTTTAADGRYQVPGLPTGSFEVVVATESMPEGFIIADDTAASGVTAISLDLGAQVPDVDFRVIGTSMLHGWVWNDRDGDEFAGDSEVGVAGVGVHVSWSGPAGDVGLVVQTDPFGEWELNYVPAGVYDVELVVGTTPAGMIPTTLAQFPLVLSPGSLERADFGIALLLAVGTRVWIDENGNGLVDESEPGIPGALVNLYDELGALVDFTAADADGIYSFADLYPGRYSVQVDYQSVPDNLRPSWDRDGNADLVTDIDLTQGVFVLDANFGFQVGLPLTGFDVDVLAIWGALLTLLGIALVGIARLYTWQGPRTAPAALSS